MGLFDEQLECPFCALVEDGNSPVWKYLFGDTDGTETLFRTEHFTVILDTAPLVQGHLLVVSKDHIPSLASSAPAGRQELIETKLETEDRVRFAYGPCTFFEHGAFSFSRNAGSCVDHAHLHIVPGIYDLSRPVSADFPAAAEYKDYAEALDSLRGKPYLLFGNDASRVTGTVAPVCATQYLRRLVAGLARAHHRWNWRDCIRLADTNSIRTDLIRARDRLTQ
jgi:diadenosine tetraphosphate (Ap4A) HIT family hydrolase